MAFNFLKKVFKKYSKMDESFICELEESLIEADVGMVTTDEIIDIIKNKRVDDGENLKGIIKNIIGDYLLEGSIVKSDGLKVILFFGINGVGKTTSVAKMANFLKNMRYKVRMVAGDTFRAAGVEQLKIWGERLKIPVVSQPTGSDPASVVYDGISSAIANNDDYLLVDTAGRMHTREDLMRQLDKIFKVIEKRIDRNNIENIALVDATTGQNGFNQLTMFKKSLPVTGIFLAKFDSTFKAGIIIRICNELKIPIKFIGTGEKIDDISVFSKDDFLEKLI